MKQKGQANIILAGVLFLCALFFFTGWFVKGKWFSSPESFKDINKIEIIEDANQKNGVAQTSEIHVDNCLSTVESKIIESRDFTYQQIYKVDLGGEFGLGFKESVYLKLQQKYHFENGNVEQVTREFEFPSPPKMKSIHTIEWIEKIRTGDIKYAGQSFPYSFPADIQISSSSRQEPCQ